MKFHCGHPRTPENSTRGYLHQNGKRYPQCRFCQRVYKIGLKVERDQARLNAGLPVDGRIGAAADWL